jgi:hypothetical protein
MEIKRSAYSGVGKKMSETLSEDRVYSLVGDVAKKVKVLSNGDENALFSIHPGIGVICIKEDNRSDSALDDLIHKGIVVVLFDASAGRLKPNTEAIHRLINFLILTRLRAKIMDGSDFVNVPLLSADCGKVAALGMIESHVPTQILA